MKIGETRSAADMHKTTMAKQESTAQPGFDPMFAEPNTGGPVRPTTSEFNLGRIRVELNGTGQPTRVNYYDEDGVKLTASSFSPSAMLYLADKFGIDRSIFSELADQMDEAGVNYQPYELFAGTGSNHGIDLRNLAAGGLGTVFDWAKDEQKADLKIDMKESEPLLKRNVGIDPNRFSPQEVFAYGILRHVVHNDGVAAWFKTEEQALDFIDRSGGDHREL